MGKSEEFTAMWYCGFVKFSGKRGQMMERAILRIRKLEFRKRINVGKFQLS